MKTQEEINNERSKYLRYLRNSPNDHITVRNGYIKYDSNLESKLSDIIISGGLAFIFSKNAGYSVSEIKELLSKFRYNCLMYIPLVYEYLEIDDHGNKGHHNDIVFLVLSNLVTEDMNIQVKFNSFIDYLSKLSSESLIVPPFCLELNYRDNAKVNCEYCGTDLKDLLRSFFGYRIQYLRALDTFSTSKLFFKSLWLKAPSSSMSEANIRDSLLEMSPFGSNYVNFSSVKIECNSNVS